MAARSLLNIRDDAKALLDLDDDLFISSTNQIAFANIANREVYRMIARHAPSFLMETTAVTWSAGPSIDLPTELTTAPYQIVMVLETPAAGAISDSNRPWKWFSQDTRDQDHADYYRSGILAGLDLQTPKSPTHYFLEGDAMKAIPIPTENRFIHIIHIKQPTALAVDADEVLNGKAEMFGDAVMYRLAVLMNAKQEGQNPTIGYMWQEATDSIKKEGRRLIQSPRRVHSSRRR
jgi:hypothetical protein